MRILFIGDIFGRPGRTIVKDRLPGIVRDRGIDLIIANGENSAAGFWHYSGPGRGIVRTQH